MTHHGTDKETSVKIMLVLFLAAVGGDWPQFRGPKRDGVSTETNLLKRWPESGPKLIWRAKGIGKIFHRLAEQLFLRQASTYREIMGD